MAATIKTTRVAPGVYALSIRGTDYWLDGFNGPGLWLVQDRTTGDYWRRQFPTKRAAIEAVCSDAI